MKLISVFCLTLVLFAASVRSECCPSIVLGFRRVNNTCGHVIGGKKYGEMCKVRLCGDGKKTVGTYCGAGGCNIFGCNCDGGCIHGDPLDYFLKANDMEESDVSGIARIEEFLDYAKRVGESVERLAAFAAKII